MNTLTKKRRAKEMAKREKVTKVAGIVKERDVEAEKGRDLISYTEITLGGGGSREIEQCVTYPTQAWKREEET